jgi:hypothetical protein
MTATNHRGKHILTPRLKKGLSCYHFSPSVSSYITKYYSGNEIKKNEMGGACSTYGGKARSTQDFGAETWGKANTLETQVQMWG